MLSRVLVGDIFLCSGQSNMEFTTSSAFNATEEEAKADTYTSKPIRVFQYKGHTSRTPVQQGGKQASWAPASANSVKGFSAVCWFGGRDTFDALGGKVPIGVIESDVGGTGVEFWSPAAAIAECNQSTPSTSGPSGNDASLYNGWIAPFTVGPMALKSIVWYQGESNTCPQQGGRPCGGIYYACQYASMIKHWRLAFGNASMPFATVLLAPDQKAVSSQAIILGSI